MKNDNLGGYSFGETPDGKPGFRNPGADTVTPFSNLDLESARIVAGKISWASGGNVKVSYTVPNTKLFTYNTFTSKLILLASIVEELTLVILHLICVLSSREILTGFSFGQWPPLILVPTTPTGVYPSYCPIGMCKSICEPLPISGKGVSAQNDLICIRLFKLSFTSQRKFPLQRKNKK